MSNLCKKLHLGCGTIHLDGYVNVDVRYQPGVDRVDNIGILRGIEDDSIDEIYCCHALDHFSRWDYPRALRRWLRILKPGGELKLSVINFEAMVHLYRSGTPLKRLIGCLVAAQDYESNVRRMHWDFPSLESDLLEAGFNLVERASPFADDCSSWTEGSTLISLNVRAIK